MISRISLFTTLLFICFSFLSCEDMGEDPQLSDEEVANGLKEALRVGTDTSVAILNKEDGYFGDQALKIFLPAEADVIIENLALIPGGQLLVDEVVLLINRSAEDAAAEATPIFVNIISNMTIEDAWEILNGDDTAATHYLKVNSYQPLKDLYKPKMEASLGKTLIAGTPSAQEAYAALVNTYNDAATVANAFGGNYQIVANNSLADHATTKALDGLFTKIAEEEKAIRTDPVARVTEILEEVFAEK